MRALVAVCVALMGCGARTGLAERGADDAAVDGAVAPEDPRVVFTFFDGRGNVQMLEMHADGEGLREVRLPTGRGVHATFTRDGRFMLYVGLGPTEDAPLSIRVLDLRTRASRVLLTRTALSALAVSPDGRSVVYTAGLDLRVIGWDGTGDRLLVQGPYNAGCCAWGYGHPDFTRDGRSVLYATAGRIEEIGLDRSGRRLLVAEDFRRIIFPNVAVSPDRSRFVAAVSCADERALRVYALASLPGSCASGAVLTEVETATSGNQANNPAWGDDRVAYQSGRDVFIVDASGGAPRNLTGALTGATGEDAAALYPAWVPRGAVLP